jgi:hypothetical protein
VSWSWAQRLSAIKSELEVNGPCRNFIALGYLRRTTLERKLITKTNNKNISEKTKAQIIKLSHTFLYTRSKQSKTIKFKAHYQ